MQSCTVKRFGDALGQLLDCMSETEWANVVEHQLSNFSAISWREQANFQWDDEEVHFVLDQHA